MVTKSSTSKQRRSTKTVRKSTKNAKSSKTSKRKNQPEDRIKGQIKGQVETYKKPHNHNALIASSANDTLDNIRVSLDMIREVACSDNDGMALSEDTKQGLFLHIENLIKAVSFLRAKI
ncbi:MAG: hypothetical protein ACPH15_02775 [Pseudomonadales bacterium]